MKTVLTILLALLPKAIDIDYDKVKLLRVCDGDTIVVDLPCEDTLYCKSIYVRIKGIDTPELRGKCPKEKEKAVGARDFLRQLLSNKKLRLVNCSRGKYFRIVCNVYANNKDVSKQLLKEGLARPYNKQSQRKSWCN